MGAAITAPTVIQKWYAGETVSSMVCLRKAMPLQMWTLRSYTKSTNSQVQFLVPALVDCEESAGAFFGVCALLSH